MGPAKVGLVHMRADSGFIVVFRDVNFEPRAGMAATVGIVVDEAMGVTLLFFKLSALDVIGVLSHAIRTVHVVDLEKRLSPTS